MQRTQCQQRKGKYLKRRNGSFCPVNKVSLLSMRAKRRLYCKLQLWLWRRRREYPFMIYRTKKRITLGSYCRTKRQSQKDKRKRLVCPELNVEEPLVKTSGNDACGSEDTFQKMNESESLAEPLIVSSCVPNHSADARVPAAIISLSASSQKTVELTETMNHVKPCHSIKPLCSADCNASKGFTQVTIPRMVPAWKLEADHKSEQHRSVTQGQEVTADRDSDERISREKSASPLTDACLKALNKDIYEFLNDFYRKYGSFIPLQKNDVLNYLKRRFDTDFSNRKNLIFSEVTRCRTMIIQKAAPSFLVVYKKHTLTLEDLLTLAVQNWLNDQVMNMYGELIMESSNHKVHFLNSFFHRQLMTKGYDGVKRWTKQVDLFSKSLLLVPIHLEVHWCLVMADIAKKQICLYDSQGNALQKVARNILKYLMKEAKEKKQTSFENGWMVSFEENIPQQTNENDCGVFVLEYSRCLALMRPFQFSQKDIPKIRKRIYKELCDCKLHEQEP
ncbi:sentrin-specific protease 5-like isoform 1-T2 [Pholidichthys leucotaenia]